MKSIAGRTAVVTGAGSGIGRAVAMALAEQGARVAVTDVAEDLALATARSIREAGGEAHAFRLDVADPEQVVAAAAQIVEAVGVPAVLVNNAGIAVGGLFLDTRLESWQRILAVNLMGVVHCCRAFVPMMVAAGQPGQVVNIASMLGYAGLQGVSAYCATKFGVMGFSECLRAELAGHGIGVSTICPGVVRTNIIQAGILESGKQDVELKRRAIAKLYERRNYPPERVARAVVRAIRRNSAVAPVTPEAWAVWYLKRWAPWLVAWVVRKQFA